MNNHLFIVEYWKKNKELKVFLEIIKVEAFKRYGKPLQNLYKLRVFYIKGGVVIFIEGLIIAFALIELYFFKRLYDME